MDYKKKYKELVEILNKANEDNETKYKTFSCVFDDIMSKIKANEDERIGDEIIHFVTTTHDTRLVGNKKHVDEWVSWIDEQKGKDKLIEELGAWKVKYIQEVLSEKTKCQNKHKFNIGDVITNGKVVYRVDNIVKNAIGQDCYFLVNVEMEKNGRRYLTMSVRGETSYMGETTWLCEQVDKSFEKQREQKPSYMFKPKFHKGDFIKHNKANIICKVISVDVGSYYVENIETNGGIELFNAEQNFHLWSIEDAKDGDVLHSPEHNLLWIYKNKEESHIAVNLNYANSISFGSDIVIPSDVCPATKEERDLLFSKMKEAGYEWYELDAEKKEPEKTHVIDEGKSEIDYCFTKMMNGEKVSPTCSEEEERIRKIITLCLEECVHGDIIRDYEKDDAIVWLEKQEGCEHIRKEWFEHIKQSWYKEGFIDGKYSNKTPKEWTINDATTLNELIDFLENGTAKLQHDLTRYANWLKIQFTPIEKQCNPTDEEMKELLRTEYEKGRADAFAEMEKEVER